MSLTPAAWKFQLWKIFLELLNAQPSSTFPTPHHSRSNHQHTLASTPHSCLSATPLCLEPLNAQLIWWNGNQSRFFQLSDLLKGKELSSFQMTLMERDLAGSQFLQSPQLLMNLYYRSACQNFEMPSPSLPPLTATDPCLLLVTASDSQLLDIPGEDWDVIYTPTADNCMSHFPTAQQFLMKLRLPNVNRTTLLYPSPACQNQSNIYRNLIQIAGLDTKDFIIPVPSPGYSVEELLQQSSQSIN